MMKSNNAFICRETVPNNLAYAVQSKISTTRASRDVYYLYNLPLRRVVLMRRECKSFTIKERRSRSNELAMLPYAAETPHSSLNMILIMKRNIINKIRR